MDFFYPKNKNPKMRTPKILNTKWLSEINKKTLKGRAIKADRFKNLHYGYEFDNITDTNYEDIVNKKIQRKATIRQKINKSIVYINTPAEEHVLEKL